MRRSPEEVLARVHDGGLLLQTTAVDLLAGETVKGSWWGREDGKAIFRGLQVLGEDPDLARLRLLAGKTTFVHRRLWPALAAVGAARAPWQLAGIAAPEEAALAEVDAAGELSSRDLPDPRLAGKLEARLLVAAREVHTERGAHAKMLTAWPRWAALNGITPRASLDAAMAEIELAAEAAYGAAAPPPWL
jgi:hypothetical protein